LTLNRTDRLNAIDDDMPPAMEATGMMQIQRLSTLFDAIPTTFHGDAEKNSGQLLFNFTMNILLF
jgi:hypothetical protein